jgi:transcriptional regulator with XRE-family HTH domain
MSVVQKNAGGRPTKEVVEKKRRELNSRQRAYVVWSATPPAEREIQTQRELCEVLGVSSQAVWQWSKDARVQEAVRFLTLQNAADPKKIQMILDMIFDVAMSKQDVRHAEVWLKASGVMGQFGRGSDLLDVSAELEQESIADMTLEELQRVRELALAERSEAAAIEMAKRSMNG